MTDVGWEGVRDSYERATLTEAEALADPFAQLRRWLDDAIDARVAEPTAMVVSTVDATSQPRSRTVLLRQLTDEGLVFFTNLDSAKAVELRGEPRCAAQLGWLDLQRQVRVEGVVVPLGDAESDAYFAGRPRGSQIGAWASPQSEAIDSREVLERLVEEVEERFEGVEVPRPDHWGGLMIVPHRFEFWQGRPSRLHDRLRYERSNGDWPITRLAP